MVTKVNIAAQNANSAAQRAAFAQSLQQVANPQQYQVQGGNPYADLGQGVSSLYQGGGLLGGGAAAATAGTGSAVAGGAGALTAPGALTPGLVTTAPLGGAASSGGLGGLSSTGSSLSAGAGLLSMAAILGMGAFGMPKGGMAASKAINDKRIRNKYETDVKPILDASRAGSIPAGMSVYDYNLSRQPPKSPADYMVEDIWGNDEGDKDWQMDEAQMYSQTAAGKAESKKFYLANPKWYNPNGTRTDYAGPYAPPMSVQNQMAVDNFGVGNATKYQPLDNAIRNLTPSPGSIAAGGSTVNTGGTQTGSNSGGVLPPPPQQQQPEPTGVLAPPANGRPGWLQEGAPEQMYNGQKLYQPQERFVSQNYFGGNQ